MASRVVTLLAATMLLALTAVGCGSASTSTSSTSSRTGGNVGAGNSAAARAAAAPSGFTRYREHGFSFLAPSGLKAASGASIPGLPRDGWGEYLTPGGRRLQSSNASIIALYNPHVNLDLDVLATRLRAADANDPTLRNVHTNQKAVDVPGPVLGARLVTESFVGPAGNGTKTRFERAWLMVKGPKPNTLVDLVVEVEPDRGGSLDPATVLGSLRLDS